jgi:ribosomal protein S18 acetylase RimI-like enzyme
MMDGGRVGDWIATAEGERFRVRRLTPADGPLLYEFFGALSERSRTTFRPHAPWDRATADAVAAGTESHDEVRFLALAGDERPAAYGFLTRVQSGRPVLGLAVADDCQQKGVGQALARYVLAEARRLGVAAVRLTVDDDNPRARHVYFKLGFREVRLVHEMEIPLS